MTTATYSIGRDLYETLARLRIARTVGDNDASRVAEARLNWLIDTKLTRNKHGNQ